MQVIEFIREDWVTLVCKDLHISASGPTKELAYQALWQAIEFNEYRK